MLRIAVLVIIVVLAAGGYVFRERLQAIWDATKGWRTMAWNGFLTLGAPSILLVLDQIRSLDLSQYMTPLNASIALMVIGVVGLFLRWITTGPIGSKGEEQPTAETKAGD